MTTFENLWWNVVKHLQELSWWDMWGFFAAQAQALILPTLQNWWQELGTIIAETPKIIVIHPELEELSEVCRQASIGILAKDPLVAQQEWIDLWCIRSQWPVSHAVFWRIIDDITFAEALTLPHIQHFEHKNSSSFRTRVTVGSKGRKQWVFQYGGTWTPRYLALRGVITRREELLAEQDEAQQKQEAKTPNLKVARSLVKKSILTEYEQWKFKIKSMKIRCSSAESTMYDLHIDNDRISAKTTRSLNEHDFPTAYRKLIDVICEKVVVTPEEKKELMKYWTRDLYT